MSLDPENAADALLSLSLATASAIPIPVARDPSRDAAAAAGSFNGSSSSGPAAGALSSASVGSKTHLPHKHRRLSSTGQARRRLSDAREATSRPSPLTLTTAAAALNSLAKLTLSGTPPPQTSTTLVTASGVMNSAPASGSAKEEADEDVDVSPVKPELGAAGISVKSSTGKRRGTIFKCESCSKVYRHPSCLIKHRWEHSPHWRETSKLMLSKHQQVQLLEAAAILSHMSPSAHGGTSLPEDRSLWPSFLSGGLLPPPSPANLIHDSKTPDASKPIMSTFTVEPSGVPFPTSSSVPAPSLLSASRSGPRMHDYSIPTVGGITQLRPGVLGIPTGPEPSPVSGSPVQRSAAVPMPMPNTHRDHDSLGYSFASQLSDSWSSPVSLGYVQLSFRSSLVSASAIGQSYSDGTGGWSLPRSSLRSGSRSRSGSASESEIVDIDSMGDGDELTQRRYAFSLRSRTTGDKGRSVSIGHDKIEEEWDGEMEMEM